jgi:hypothetical protein
VPAPNGDSNWPRGDVDQLTGPKKAAAKLAGFDGAYLRFAGELRIEHHQGAELVDSFTEDALWELMYFGKALV